MKKYLILTLVSIFIFTFTFPVLALEKDGTGDDNKPVLTQEDRKSLRESLLLKIRETRCERITERVQNKIYGFDKNKEKHVIAYTNLEKRANKVISDLKVLGYDVTILENDMKTYDIFVQAFLTKYNLFVDSIKGAKIIACDDQDNANGFKNQVEASRNYLKDAREAAKSIRTFVKDTLRPHFLDIKDQIKETKLNDTKDEK